MNYLYAFLLIVAGFLIEVYTFRIVRTFGHLQWAEQYLGPGGTYTAWRIIGLLCIIGGFWVFRNPVV